METFNICESKRLNKQKYEHARVYKFNMLNSTSLSAANGTREGINEAHSMSNCIGLHYTLMKILSSKKYRDESKLLAWTKTLSQIFELVAEAAHHRLLTHYSC